MMIKPIKFSKNLLTGLACVALLASAAQAREIALTFDDAPTPDSALLSGEARTQKIIHALTDARVPGALFYVTAQNINPASAKRLNAYTQNGFELAHHSFAHASASKISQRDYLADFDKAHTQLRAFDKALPLHRFPFLHYGADLDAVMTLQRAIASRGYQDGYVTVDNFDWYFNSLIVNAVAEDKTVDWDKARALYVETLYAGIEFYDALAQQVLKRSPRHVLLLHENDAAALFVGDLIAHLRHKGWTIITPARAYQDKIAQTFPATAFHGQGRIAAIAHSQGIDPVHLRHPSESEAYWNDAVAAAGIISPGKLEHDQPQASDTPEISEK